ncbi:MAG: PASTA domain-containing protein [Ignavibacteriaceae bacterium]
MDNRSSIYIFELMKQAGLQENKQDNHYKRVPSEMKINYKQIKKILKSQFVRRLLYFFAIIFVLLLLIDKLFLPWYVDSPETVVPDVVGMKDTDAIELLQNSGFEPLVIDTTYGESYPEGIIFLQKPTDKKIVKVGRKIYLFVSGGAHLVSVPQLIGKTMLDAKFALERIGLKLGRVTQLPSDKPKDMIFDQQFAEATTLNKGQTVNISVSAGRSGGSIIVPNLIGKSLEQAESILASKSLLIGKINFQTSQTLLPNTVLDQYPSRGNKLNPGEKVDLFVTKSSDPEILEE